MKKALLLVALGTVAVTMATPVLSEEIYISPEEHAARLVEQERMAQEIREKMKEGITDDAALRDALHIMLASAGPWVALARELIQEFGISPKRAVKMLEGMAREKLAAMERGEWDTWHYSAALCLFEAFPDYDCSQIFKEFLKSKHDSVQMGAIMTYINIKGASAIPLIQEAVDAGCLDGQRRNILYESTPSVINRLMRENKAREAETLAAFINKMKQNEPELKLDDAELKQKIFGYTGFSEIEDNTIHTLINRNGISTEQMTRVIEDVVREGTVAAVKGRDAFWEWDNENDRMMYNTFISRLGKALYLLPLLQNANTVALLKECVLCKDENISLSAMLSLIDFWGAEALPFLLECFEKGRLTQQTRWIFYANLDITFSRFKEKYGNNNVGKFYAFVKDVAQLEHNGDEIYAKRIDKFLCSNFDDYENSAHCKENRGRLARLEQITERLDRISALVGRYSPEKFREEAQKCTLEKGITSEEMTKELERRLQDFIAILESKHGVGYLRHSSYVIGCLKRNHIKILEAFNGPDTLALLREFTLAGYKYEFFRSEAIITYVNIAGGVESIPFLSEALGKKNCVTDSTRSELFMHLEKIAAKLTEANKTNDAENINAFIMKSRPWMARKIRRES